MTEQPKPKLHPIILELCKWAHEHGLHETGWLTVLDQVDEKHHEIKMKYYEKTVKGKVPK